MRASGCGAIAAGHARSAAAGAEILAAGGNAADALVAAVVASWAAEPSVSSPGGGGFLLYRDAGAEEVTLLDFFVAVPGRGAPSRSRPMDAFDVDFGTTLQRFFYGAPSVAVPGVLAGVAEAHRRWGSRPWADLLAPGARLASAGVELIPQHAALHRLLDPVLKASKAGREVFSPGGRPLVEGELVVQEALAALLERLARTGAADLYGGELGALASRQVQAEGGRLTLDDLASYEVVERAAVRVRYRGTTVLTNAPPSSGGVLLARALGVHDRLGPALEPHSGAWIRRAAATLREAEELRTPELQRWILGGGGRELAGEDALAGAASAVRRNLGRDVESFADGRTARGTSHVSVVDRHGNAASLTSSTGCGSGVFVGDTGLHLNNMLGEEDLTTNAADPRPGSRMTSMMSPTLVTGPGFEAVLGSSGSARIRSAIFRIVTALVDDRVSATDAVALPRVHPTGATLECEAGFPEAALDEARAAGEPVNAWPDRNIYFGGAQVALVRDGRVDAAGDPRRGGYGIVLD